MKRTIVCLFLLVFIFPAILCAQTSTHQQGVITRMRMTDCIGPQHGFMAAMSGSGKIEPGAMCPEYVLVSEKVVYVISGKNSNQLIPLAETTRFHLRKNELLIRVDDESKESRFTIKAMVLRAEWDRNQMLQQAEATALISQHMQAASGEEQP